MSVYEEGSITSAAKKHFISQVAMSQQIQSLEEELGVKLFLRQKKKLHQTSAAHYFYYEIKNILSLYDALLIDLKNYSNGNKMVLRIGVNYYSLYEWLKNYSDKFEESYHDINISFEFYPSNELISQLDKGFIDIILIWDKYASNLGFITKPAFISHCTVLIPFNNPLSNLKSFSLDLLKGQRIVMLVEELPYFRRTGHLEEVLSNFYDSTPIKNGDIIVTDNINQALFLSSEENLIIITYEDKLYKIPQKNMKSIIMDHSFMDSNFVFAYKSLENNMVVKLFMNFIEENNHF